MTPTNDLRFVERPATFISGEKDFSRTVRILQQKWIGNHTYFDESGNQQLDIEWRDVRVEKEQP
jgi:hypothetical protein